MIWYSAQYTELRKQREMRLIDPLWWRDGEDGRNASGGNGKWLGWGGGNGLMGVIG